jgi:hypothetical protein
MPYLLIILGLATSWLGVGVLGLIAGVGMLWRKNWAGKLGLIFSILISWLGIFVAIVAAIGVVSHGVSYGFNEIDLSVITFFASLLVLLSLLVINTLTRETAKISIGTFDNCFGVLYLFICLSATIVGIVPGWLIIKKARFGREIAYLFLVCIFFAAIVWGIAATIAYPHDGVPFLHVFVVIAAGNLCFQSFRYLRSPKIRAYYENREV